MGGNVEPVEHVGQRDGEEEGGEGPLVVVARGLFPDEVRYRVGAVGEPRRCLGQRERGPLGVREVRRPTPRRKRDELVVGHARVTGRLRPGLDARTAPVDLARPEVGQFERSPRDVIGLCRSLEGEEGVHRVREHDGGVLHAGGHVGVGLVRGCHVGRGSPVTHLTALFPHV